MSKNVIYDENAHQFALDDSSGGGSSDTTIQQAINNGDKLEAGFCVKNDDDSYVVDVAGKHDGKHGYVFVNEGRVSIYSEEFKNNDTKTQAVSGKGFTELNFTGQPNDLRHTDFRFNDNGNLSVHSKITTNGITKEFDYLLPNINGTDRDVVCYDSEGNMNPMRLGWSQFSDLDTPPEFNSGVLSGTTFNPDGTAMFYFHELNSGINADAKENTIPVYGTNGVLKVADGENDKDAVNLGQLNARAIPEVPASGSFLLMSMDGVLTWIPN